MGVMACDRTDCENVMCNHFMSVLGREYYICHRCLDQLEALKDSWPDDFDPRKVEPAIAAFMETPPTTTTVKPTDTALDVFERLKPRNLYQRGD